MKKTPSKSRTHIFTLSSIHSKIEKIIFIHALVTQTNTPHKKIISSYKEKFSIFKSQFRLLIHHKTRKLLYILDPLTLVSLLRLVLTKFKQDLPK